MFRSAFVVALRTSSSRVASHLPPVEFFGPPRINEPYLKLISVATKNPSTQRQYTPLALMDRSKPVPKFGRQPCGSVLVALRNRDAPGRLPTGVVRAGCITSRKVNH